MLSQHLAGIVLENVIIGICYFCFILFSFHFFYCLLYLCFMLFYIPFHFIVPTDVIVVYCIGSLWNNQFIIYSILFYLYNIVFCISNKQ